MIRNPLNQLPTNPEWVRKVDELTLAASRELGCVVMMVAIQENGKLGISMEGEPESGPLAEALKDVPKFLMSLGIITAAYEHQEGAQRTN